MFIIKNILKFAMLVHPDRNQKRREDATKAYKEIEKSRAVLTSTEGREACTQVIEEANTFITSLMKKNRSALKKQGLKPVLLEDDPEEFKKAMRKRVTVVFADMELMKDKEEQKKTDEK